MFQPKWSRFAGDQVCPHADRSVAAGNAAAAAAHRSHAVSECRGSKGHLDLFVEHRDVLDDRPSVGHSEPLDSHAR